MNILTIYAFKSSVGINWQSPKKLAASVVKNEAMRYLNGNTRLLGHMSVRLRCGDKEIITAMTSRDGETKNMVLKEHSGLGVLFHIFPGELETAAKLEPEIAKKRKNGFVNSVTYMIDDHACEDMLNHFENYKNNGGHHNYGFPVDTLAGEGGGCSAFAVSFLQAAKIAPKDHLKEWSGEVWVPNKYIGPHNSELYTAANQDVFENTEGGDSIKLFKFLLKKGKTSWAKPTDPEARQLQFFDPDMVFRWINKVASERNKHSAFQVRRFQKSYDVVFDLRRN